MQPGIYGVYKPVGPTSHDIIDKLRNLTGVKTIGHAGTLDPLAEGVLVVAIGREFTKQLSQIVGKEKEYEAQIKLGSTSLTDDSEGPITPFSYSHQPNLTEIKQVLTKFSGEIDQIPPTYSALKIKGKSAYQYARQGKAIAMKSRKVFIKSIDPINYQWPILKIKVVCGPGVYIRTLAKNIGENLHTGGYLNSLTRTRVGEFKIKEALRI